MTYIHAHIKIDIKILLNKNVNQNEELKETNYVTEQARTHDNKRTLLLKWKKVNISVVVTLSKVCEHIIKLVTKRKTQVKKRDMIKQKYIHPLL